MILFFTTFIHTFAVVHTMKVSIDQNLLEIRNPNTFWLIFKEFVKLLINRLKKIN